MLIIGGGDGGVTRVLDAHPAVKEITLCEIDEVTPIEIVGGTFVENLWIVTATFVSWFVLLLFAESDRSQ